MAENKVGALIKEARSNAKLTQAALAEAGEEIPDAILVVLPQRTEYELCHGGILRRCEM